MNIAIQGIQGSFHHLVALDFFGNDITLTECMSFSEIPELVITNQVDAAIMAIENSNAGAILSNYALIDNNDLNIKGEFYLPMIHNLMALKGQTIDDIKEVWSHPIAIQHCKQFFKDHPTIKIIEERDTASVAKHIKENKLKGVAAIASKKAAEIFGLTILEEEIQNDRHNMTRFFVLTKKREHQPDDYLNNKASLKFVTHHQLGNLAEILNICVKHNLNLSKIQSIPITEEPWHYAFFIDLCFDNYHKYCQALLEIEPRVDSLKILGEYLESKPKFHKMTA
ncbi:MAG: prephenate dehydratase [Flavobacteriaceae bacterium]|nr:prephenate dehydratase [Flavobacteriaceae bacterium]